MLQIFKKHHEFNTHLFRQWTSLAGLTTDFEITAHSHMTVNGHVNLKHRGICVGAVGYALVLVLERKDTLALLGPRPSTEFFGIPTGWVFGSKTGGNINGIADHYAEGQFEGYQLLSPGAYRLKLLGVSHSDAAPLTDGLIEVLTDASHLESGTYNQMITRVESL